MDSFTPPYTFDNHCHTQYAMYIIKWFALQNAGFIVHVLQGFCCILCANKTLYK